MWSQRKVASEFGLPSGTWLVLVVSADGWSLDSGARICRWRQAYLEARLNGFFYSPFLSYEG